MKITAMRYRELKTGSGYNHKAVEMEAEPTDYLAHPGSIDHEWNVLVRLVEAKLAEKSIGEIEEQRYQMGMEYTLLANDKIRLEAEVKALRASVEELRAEKKAVGGQEIDDEIPF